jgi:two-component system, NarL family, sensor kinase
MTILVMIATLGVVVLIFFIILFVLLYQKRMLANRTLVINKEKDHQKKLLDASLEIAEQERQRIATNIHDDVGLNLNLLKINFNKLQKGNLQDELTETILATSYGLIENSMDIIRGIYNDIRPKTLITLGLAKALKELCREINISGETEIMFSETGEVLVSDKTVEIQLYRLIKEVLNNTIKHAKPGFVEINIATNENTVIVSILHNGMGITTEKIKELAKESKGLGLKGIFTRIGLLEASIDFSEGAGNKAEVIIKCKL